MCQQWQENDPNDDQNDPLIEIATLIVFIILGISIIGLTIHFMPTLWVK